MTPSRLDEAAVARMEPLIGSDEDNDVVGGAAGALQCLLALHAHRASRMGWVQPRRTQRSRGVKDEAVEDTVGVEGSEGVGPHEVGDVEPSGHARVPALYRPSGPRSASAVPSEAVEMARLAPLRHRQHVSLGAPAVLEVAHAEGHQVLATRGGGCSPECQIRRRWLGG